MQHPWVRHLAATLILVVGGIASADPLFQIGGPAVSVDVDTEKVNSITETTAKAAAGLLEAIGDFLCKLFPCGGTGAPQPPAGGGNQDPPAQPQSVLPIPDDWATDPRYVGVSGRLPLDAAAEWLARIRVASSTYEGGAVLVRFERMDDRDALSFLTFHQELELPEASLRAFRLEGRHVVPAGTYRVDGLELKIPIEPRR